MKTIHTNQGCPYCHYQIDFIGGPGGDTPGPGHITICYNCSGILILDNDLKIQKLSPEQYEAIHWVTKEKIRLVQNYMTKGHEPE